MAPRVERPSPTVPHPTAAPAGVDDVLIGAHIRSARRHRGMSMRALARAIGVGPTTMSQLETGRTRVSAARLAGIAGALDVPLQDLVSATPEPAERRRSAPEPVPARGRDRTAVADAVLGPEPSSWREVAPLHLDRVLRAAVASFAEVGYHGSTVRDIAARAGVSTPGLYHRYAGKEELLGVVVAVAARETARRVGAARREAGDPAGRLALMTEALVLQNTGRNDVAGVALTEYRHLDATGRAAVAADRAAIQEMVDAVVRDGVASGAFGTAAPRDASRAVVLLCTALITWYRPTGPDAPADLARRHAALALRMVEARG